MESLISFFKENPVLIPWGIVAGAFLLGVSLTFVLMKLRFRNTLREKLFSQKKVFGAERETFEKEASQDRQINLDLKEKLSQISLENKTLRSEIVKLKRGSQKVSPPSEGESLAQLLLQSIGAEAVLKSPYVQGLLRTLQEAQLGEARERFTRLLREEWDRLMSSHFPKKEKEFVSSSPPPPPSSSPITPEKPEENGFLAIEEEK